MSALLESLRTRAPLPAFLPTPPPHWPLPVGPYPTAAWPAGLVHLALTDGVARMGRKLPDIEPPDEAEDDVEDAGDLDVPEDDGADLFDDLPDEHAAAVASDRWERERARRHP